MDHRDEPNTGHGGVDPRPRHRAQGNKSRREEVSAQNAMPHSREIADRCFQANHKSVLLLRSEWQAIHDVRTPRDWRLNTPGESRQRQWKVKIL
jgi:hypothetical protein